MHWPVTTRDLAPGDAKSAKLDLSRYDLVRIHSRQDPIFEEAYGRLWHEFGPKDSMEVREVLGERFLRRPRIFYEMAMVHFGEDVVAVRDHTAALTPDGAQVAVHLSHNLVLPAARRTGLAGWMRALPLAAARECLAANAGPPHAPITLIAEMEYANKEDPRNLIRLTAYERAGFRKIDPGVVKYFQPDFRSPSMIDASGGPRPLPHQLLVRRVRREHERVILGREVRQLVESLYSVYCPELRPADLAHPALSLNGYPKNEDIVPLVAPTQC